MAAASVRRRTQFERSLRRLDCLARMSADRRSVERRRLAAATSLDVFVRRAERAAGSLRAV